MGHRAVCVLVGLVLIGLGGAAGVLRVAVSTEPPGLDPTTNAAGIIRRLLHHNVYECLVQVNERGELQPQLATAWEVSSDGLAYTFLLREGVRFHNGETLNAEAVKQSFARAMDPATGHPRPEYYAGIVEIEAVDEHRVRFHIAEPDAAFLSLLALGESVIVPPGAEDLARHPSGTGPFTFSEWRPADRLVLQRNPDYYMPGVPAVEGVVFRFIADPAAQRAALLAGAVDVVAEITPELAVELEPNPRFTVVSGPSNLVQILAVNNERSPFDDLLVRQALAHAVDRDAVIERVFFGLYGTPIGSHLTPALPFYRDMTALYPHDPHRARELLAEAGYPEGFGATMTLPGNYPQHVRTGEVIAAQLEQVGIRVQMERVDWATWLEQVFAQGAYDLTVIGHIGRLDPALMLTGYGPDRLDYYYRLGWRSDELDQLLEEGAVTVDTDRRTTIYGRVQEILAEEVVNVFLQDMHDIVAMRAEITGIAVYPIYVLDLSQVVLTSTGATSGPTGP